MKSQLKRYLGSLVFVFLLCLSIALGATAGVLFVYNSDLPQVNSLEDHHPSLITEVYADDGTGHRDLSLSNAASSSPGMRFHRSSKTPSFPSKTRTSSRTGASISTALPAPV